MIFNKKYAVMNDIYEDSIFTWFSGLCSIVFFCLSLYFLLGIQGIIGIPDINNPALLLVLFVGVTITCIGSYIMTIKPLLFIKTSTWTGQRWQVKIRKLGNEMMITGGIICIPIGFIQLFL